MGTPIYDPLITGTDKTTWSLGWVTEVGRSSPSGQDFSLWYSWVEGVRGLEDTELLSSAAFLLICSARREKYLYILCHRWSVLIV